MKIVDGKFGQRAPENLSQELRDLADLVDAGHVTQFICAHIKNDEYEIIYGASPINKVILATLLHRKVVDSFT